jgi:hypothetical protein
MNEAEMARQALSSSAARDIALFEIQFVPGEIPLIVWRLPV